MSSFLFYVLWVLVDLVHPTDERFRYLLSLRLVPSHLLVVSCLHPLCPQFPELRESGPPLPVVPRVLVSYSLLLLVTQIWVTSLLLFVRHLRQPEVQPCPVKVVKNHLCYSYTLLTPRCYPLRKLVFSITFLLTM